MIALNKRTAKKFDESCKLLVKKIREFEDNYFCSKCQANECEHLRKDMNKEFKEEVEESHRLVRTLAQSAIKERRQDCGARLAFITGYKYNIA